MTIELTHEQAAALRMASFPSNDAYDLHIRGLISCIDGQGAFVSDAGREALAAYDEKWVTVRRDDLRMAVEELDTKIREYDARWEGYDSRRARMNYGREVLARLVEVVK